MNWAVHVVRMGQVRYAFIILVEISKGVDYTLSIICRDLRHALRRYRQSPFVE
jgi:hypothetical protein